MEEEKIDPRKELENLVEAFEALLPSRNLVSQLIMLLPLEYDRIMDMYPELTEDHDYWNMLCNTLGLSSREEGGRIIYSVSKDSLAMQILLTINFLFNFTRNDTSRALLSTLIGRIVPNYERIWLDARLKALLNEEKISGPIRKILKVLLESEAISPKDLKEKTGLKDAEIERAVYILKEFKIVEEIYDSRLRLKPCVSRYKQYVLKVIT